MRDTKGDFIRGALIAGLIGGAVLALLMVIPAAGNAQRIWPGVQVAAYPFIGSQVFQPGFHLGAMVLGTIVHFALAFGWALAFTYLVRRRTHRAAMLLAVPFGVFIWAVMRFVALPLAGATEAMGEVSPWAGMGQHVAFTLAIAATLVLLQPQNWRFGRTRKTVAA